MNRSPAKSVRCLLVYPEFQAASFWNYRAACEIKGAKYPAAPLGLMTVAAMLPAEWDLRLVDRNVEELHERDLDWADIVFVGGMISQQFDHLAIVRRAKAKGKIVVTGGPDATSSPHLYDASDHLVLGEAELTIPRFLADFAQGAAAHIYRADGSADMATSPPPRWDLVQLDNYAYAGLQWSRGCPYNCEFCDIIELFGRVPRLKTVEQVLRELDNLFDRGHRGSVDIVDDNFIGNRREVKKLLLALRDWQERHGWPFEFGTEVSLNVADDNELLNLMEGAGFAVVFVGIETTDQDVLKAAQKKQNTKRDIVDAVHTLYAHGMMVMAGYIIGLDGESGKVASRILECIDRTAIPVNMVGLLFAMPNTQLQRRLRREGRLPKDFDVITRGMGSDQSSGGLNFVTQRPRGDVFRDYISVIEEAYSPKAYFDRVRRMALTINMKNKRLGFHWKMQKNEAATLVRMVRAVGVGRPWSPLFWKLFAEVLVKNPKAVRYALWMATLFTHFDDYSKYIVEHTRRRIDEPGPVGEPPSRSVVTENPADSAAQ